MTVKRSRYIYAGELAGWLNHAAKLLVKVNDCAVRVKLFQKIVCRTLKLLLHVDDSNAALQSVLWSGSYCFDVWESICRDADIKTIKSVLKKVLQADTEGLAKQLFFPSSRPAAIPEEYLRDIAEELLATLKFERESHRKNILYGYLIWLAQLKDEAGFYALAKKWKLCEDFYWDEAFTLLLYLERYDEALQRSRVKYDDSPYAMREVMLKIFKKNGDREMLMAAATLIARTNPTLVQYKRIAPLMTKEEQAQFVTQMIQSRSARETFDVAMCEILFAVGALDQLHAYAVEHYDDIFDANRCTGMAPLGKKLIKAGDPLAACILLRGVIWYLMNRNNSAYYADVHKHWATLQTAVQSVTRWEGIESQADFEEAFSQAFSNRRSFWS